MSGKKRSILFALLLIFFLTACGGKAPHQTLDDPQSGETEPQTSTESIEPAKPIKPVKPISPGEDLQPPCALSTLPEKNRNIPEGSNVVQVGDKWIVAANMDADYYRDCSFRTLHLFVLSRDPMDPEKFGVQLDRDDVEFDRIYVDDYSGSEHISDAFPYYDFYGYSNIDWRDYYRWTTAEYDDQEKIGAGEPASSSIDSEWRSLQEMQTNAMWFGQNGNPNAYVYDLKFTLLRWSEECEIHNITVSWPGVEQVIDIGEIRLHMEYLGLLYDLPENIGLSGLTASSGSLSYMFGPEIACSITSEITCDTEITFIGVTSLNENYPVAEVVVHGTAPGVDDQQILTAENPVVVSPGAKTTIWIYFTGPHLSELSVMGQGFFVIKCEIDGQVYHLIWEGGQQRGFIPQELYAIVMDNVDMQGYYEYVQYDPFHVNNLLGTKELYDQLGWTEQWEAMMAAD